MTGSNEKNAQKDRLTALLAARNLRPTRQRLSLAAYLFDGKPKHVTAEQVMAAAQKQKEPVSLATVYNSLHQFTRAGLLREILIDQTRRYFDTTISDHHHFFDEVSGDLWDIPSGVLRIEGLPLPPSGRKIDGIGVVVRLAKA
ncbi:MAG: iron response transcriptional regulator IrrA [Bdellovibrionales bacterium]